MTDTYRYTIKTIRVKLAVQEQPNVPLGSPHDAEVLLRTIYKDLDADQEHFCLLVLNQRNRVSGFKIIFSGGQSEALIDMKVLFRNILLMGGAGIIIAHNHPSGDPKASAEDIVLTGKIKQAAKLLDIELLDHIILGDGKISSLKEEGHI